MIVMNNLCTRFRAFYNAKSYVSENIQYKDWALVTVCVFTRTRFSRKTTQLNHVTLFVSVQMGIAIIILLLHSSRSFEMSTRCRVRSAEFHLQLSHILIRRQRLHGRIRGHVVMLALWLTNIQGRTVTPTLTLMMKLCK